MVCQKYHINILIETLVFLEVPARAPHIPHSMIKQQLTLDPQVASREEECAFSRHRSKDGWQHKPHILKTSTKGPNPVHKILQHSEIGIKSTLAKLKYEHKCKWKKLREVRTVFIKVHHSKSHS